MGPNLERQVRTETYEERKKEREKARKKVTFTETMKRTKSKIISELHAEIKGETQTAQIKRSQTNVHTRFSQKHTRLKRTGHKQTRKNN